MLFGVVAFLSCFWSVFMIPPPYIGMYVLTVRFTVFNVLVQICHDVMDLLCLLTTLPTFRTRRRNFLTFSL